MVEVNLTNTRSVLRMKDGVTCIYSFGFGGNKKLL